jgi:hypothetical protein
MPNQLQAELEQFQRFVSDRLHDDQSLSLEEAVDLWREESMTDEEMEESIAELRETLAEIDAGQLGMSREEFDHWFRERYGLPPRS